MKNILILGLWAFGYAIAKHLWDNNPDRIFYASEINADIFNAIQSERKHPYFFAEIEQNILPKNIELVENPDIILPEIDLVISVIPCQFIGNAFHWMKDSLKEKVTILNLAKWIDNNSLQCTSEKLSNILEWKSYQYAYLAGGMIASELLEWKKIGADISCEDKNIWEVLSHLFASENVIIKLKIQAVKQSELTAALKNIIALTLWYYEWQWAGASTLGYYFTALISELTATLEFLWVDDSLDLTDFSLSGDLIATCFGASRNRELGNMLGMWVNADDALLALKAQNKTAEWYETLKWLMPVFTKNKICPLMQKMWKILL